MNRIEAGGKVALVTGAADCIGLAAGIALIRAGYVYSAPVATRSRMRKCRAYRCSAAT
jgi:NAD(P)-dependent dehydrogenase (short-subunit alcohol dehydrogenase family)